MAKLVKNGNFAGLLQSQRRLLPGEPDAPRRLGLDKDEGRESAEDFDFTWKEYSTDSMARFVYEYRAQSDHVPPERFAAYVKALDRIEANLGATLFPEGGQEGGGLNYLFILLAAAGLGAGIWAARRLSAIPAWGYRAIDPALEKQVGGALWLLALGLILSPIYRLKEIWDLKYLVFQVLWKSLTVQGSEQFHPLWEPTLIVSTVLTLVGLCLACALLPMFFRRRANFPAAFAVASGVAIFGLILDQGASRNRPSCARAGYPDGLRRRG